MQLDITFQRLMMRRCDILLQQILKLFLFIFVIFRSFWVFMCEQKNVGAERFWVSPDLSYVLLAYSVHKVCIACNNALSSTETNIVYNKS